MDKGFIGGPSHGHDPGLKGRQGRIVANRHFGPGLKGVFGPNLPGFPAIGVRRSFQ